MLGETQFVAYSPKSKAAELLEDLKQESRIIYETDSYGDFAETLSTKCDYEEIRVIIRTKQKESQNILDGMLKNMKKSIITNSCCCGCKACEQVCPKYAISMKIDEKGFWYPRIDKKKCVECGLCYKVCPENFQSFQTNLPECIVYYNKDKEKQQEYSSGGAFLRICKAYVEGKEDYAIYGASITTENIVKHIRVINWDNVNQLSRSKYVQSDTENVYKQVKTDLSMNKYVVFSGTPCQVQALKNFLGKEYERLLLIDFVCHGVPSPMAYKKYCDSIAKTLGKKIDKVLFRYKQEIGIDKKWDTQGMSILFDDGTSYKGTRAGDIYMRAFLCELLSRSSCDECKFTKLNRVSDLTLGDFWGIEDKFPEYAIQNTAGTSMVLVDSVKGDKLIQKIKKELDNEVLEYVDLEIATKKNIPLNRSIVPHSKRERFYENLRKKKNWSFEECLDQALYPRGNIIQRLVRKIYKIICEKKTG